MDKARYEKMVVEAGPGSPLLKNCVCAFLFGGVLCCFGQAFTDIALLLGADRAVAGTVSSLGLITLASVLTAMNIFDRIGKVAGAGTMVPITGFANSVVSAGMEFKSEGLIFGTGVKLFQIAGPVVIYGTVLSVIYGLAYYLFI